MVIIAEHMIYWWTLDPIIRGNSFAFGYATAELQTNEVSSYAGYNYYIMCCSRFMSMSRTIIELLVSRAAIRVHSE